MKARKFLYKVETVICKDPSIDLQVRLNLLGLDGWEMITAVEPKFVEESEYFILGNDIL